MDFLQKLKRYLFPQPQTEVMREVDRESLWNIRRISLLVLCFEAVSFLAFILSGPMYDRGAFVSLSSVFFCILMCVVCYFLSRQMLADREIKHPKILIFKIVFFIVLAFWSIMVDYRHYVVGDQILTFFPVIMLMACFVLFVPWIGTALILAAYAALYIALYTFDGAARIHPLNYLVFALVSAAGMMVQFHAHVFLAQKSIKLKESNALLEQMSLHDGLTELRNRKALDQDAALADGKRMTAVMADINYFKDINDNHGHIVGDAVLREAGQKLRQLFPESLCYRYGGDEFLVLSSAAPEKIYPNDTYAFDHQADEKQIPVLICFGRAQGCPKGQEEVFDLIYQADTALYDVKRRMHSPEFGGHDRRKR